MFLASLVPSSENPESEKKHAYTRASRHETKIRSSRAMRGQPVQRVEDADRYLWIKSIASHAEVVQYQK